MPKQVELLQGTLDMLILKAISKVEAESWNRFSAVVGGILDAVPEEL